LCLIRCNEALIRTPKVIIVEVGIVQPTFV